MIEIFKQFVLNYALYLIILLFVLLFIVLAFITSLLLREYNLRNVISRYPKDVFEGSSSIEIPFMTMLNQIPPESNCLKPNHKLKMLYKLKEFWLFRKPLGYEFVSSLYAACIANLSEVARRELTQDETKIRILKEEARTLYEGIQFRRADCILNSVANTYRVMRDIEVRESKSEHVMSNDFIRLLENVRFLLNESECDVFKAYIKLTSVENLRDKTSLYISDLNDGELIFYEKLKIKLKSFVYSFEYHTTEDSIKVSIKSITDLIEQIICKKISKFNSKELINNYC
ncbi:MAG: hypothetical protein HQL06_11715 [Nitrospirae bacterium]|nr:hypothetical protein [Nitrospirota bacterium]